MRTTRIAVAVGSLLGGVLATIPSAAPAAAAPTGSIVFVRDHNIFLVRSDGSGLHQVTRDGTAASPYLSPTMSDGGIIAAARGPEVLRMQQNGVVLNRFDPPPLTNSAGQPIDGVPSYVAISPDGARIAYGWSAYSCPIGVSCQVRSAVGVTTSTGFSGPSTTSYLHHPSWVTDNRLMAHGGYLSQMMLQDLGGPAAHWFDDDDIYAESTDLGDASLTRDGRRLVAIRGYGSDTQMIWYAVSGDPRSSAASALPNPSPECQGAPGATATDPNLHDPTWSPDGSAFAIGATEGIWVVVPTADCTSSTFSLLGSGRSPSWSAAAIAPPPLPTTQPGGTGGSAETVFTLQRRPQVIGKPRVGKRLRATSGRWSPEPTAVRYTWLRNGRKIKRATKKAYTVTRRDRGRKLAVKVVVVRPGMPRASALSRAVRIR